MNDMTALLSRMDAFESEPATVALRDRARELLRLKPGDTAVDVGCGGGRAAAELAADGVTAHGVDPSEVMLTAARRRWHRVAFHDGPAETLPFADGTLDGYRAEKVFHALTDPAAAIREAHRVLRSGGRAVLLGQDWDCVVIDADDPELTRRIVRNRAAAMPSPNIARGYGNLLRDNGFTDVTVEVHTIAPTSELALPILVEVAGATPDTAEWIAEQRRRAAAGRLYVAMPMFLAAGTRD